MFQIKNAHCVLRGFFYYLLLKDRCKHTHCNHKRGWGKHIMKCQKKKKGKYTHSHTHTQKKKDIEA